MALPKTLLPLLLLAVLTDGQLEIDGECPHYQHKEGFNQADLMGDWSDYAKYPTRFNEGQKCNRIKYIKTNDTNNDKTQFEFVEYYRNTTTNKSKQKRGKAIASKRMQAMATFNFQYYGGTPSGAPGKRHLLDSDNDKYAIFWACSTVYEGVTPKSRQFVFIITRKAVIGTSLKNRLRKQMTSLGLRPADLVETDHTQC